MNKLIDPMHPSNVYVIADETGAHKVGISLNVAKRLISLQANNTLRLNVVWSITVPYKDARKIEDHAHWLLRRFDLGSEWFSCEEDQAIFAINKSIIAVSSGVSERLRNKTYRPSPHRADADHIRAVLKEVGLSKSGFCHWVEEITGCTVSKHTVHSWVIGKNPLPGTL